MTRVRWTALAADDLYRITRLSAATIRKAPAVWQRLSTMAVKTSFRLPTGDAKGTRELVFAPLPYIAVYRVIDSTVEILRIWHGAQQR